MQPNIRKEKERYIELPSHHLRSTHSVAMWKHTAAELHRILWLCMSEVKKQSYNSEWTGERTNNEKKKKQDEKRLVCAASTLHSECVWKGHRYDMGYYYYKTYTF